MKKLFAFVLSAVMVAAFAGCGSTPAETSGTVAADAAGTTAAQATTAAQTTSAAQTAQASLSDDVKNQLDDALSQAEFKGVAQITRGGKAIYQYVNGDDDNGQPLTMEASLPLGSVSKQFCAAAVMLLCDQNALSVDDKLEKYYPDYKYGKQLTIKQLLYMSSGIPDYYESFMDGSALGANEADNVNIIKEALFSKELHFEPDDDYEYSNSNYFLLADIVEQASGVPYHDFLQKNFLDPLEMTNTGFVDDIAGNAAWTAALSKTELMNETTCPGLVKGAGDVVSNAADMDKWMQGLSGGKVISADAYRQMVEEINPNSYEDYSYGFYAMPYDGIGHVGQIPPHFGAVDYLNTDRDVFLFAASNDPRGSSFVQQFPQTVLDILLES